MMGKAPYARWAPWVGALRARAMELRGGREARGGQRKRRREKDAKDTAKGAAPANSRSAMRAVRAEECPPGSERRARGTARDPTSES